MVDWYGHIVVRVFNHLHIIMWTVLAVVSGVNFRSWLLKWEGKDHGLNNKNHLFFPLKNFEKNDLVYVFPLFQDLKARILTFHISQQEFFKTNKKQKQNKIKKP